ncbi:MAG: hypothetical protein Q4F57_09740 [Weeksellaceae bacterium]|nr:hypothetical protein [Weeksellaceae bacterium]
MNISDLKLADKHASDKAVSAQQLFKATNNTATSLQILAGERLKEHTSPVPALLLCVEGEVHYGEPDGRNVRLLPGNYVLIEPDVVHFVDGIKSSQLVLFR